MKLKKGFRRMVDEAKSRIKTLSLEETRARHAVPSGFWGGRRLSLGGDVTVTGATDGATAAGGC